MRASSACVTCGIGGKAYTYHFTGVTAIASPFLQLLKKAGIQFAVSL